MTNRKPLVLATGQIEQLQAGDTLVDGSGNPIGGGAAITFGITNGAAGTSVTLPAVVTRAASLTLCLVQVVTSDVAVTLTFDVKKNGTTIFSAPQSIAAGASPGQFNKSAGLATSPTNVAADDVFTIDITSGSLNWKATIALG